MPEPDGMGGRVALPDGSQGRGGQAGAAEARAPGRAGAGPGVGGEDQRQAHFPAMVPDNRSGRHSRFPHGKDRPCHFDGYAECPG